MGSRLFWKLLALQLVAAAVMIAGVLAVMRLHTTHSLAAFVASQEQRRLHELAQRLADSYARTGDLESAAQAVLEELPEGPRRRRGPPGHRPGDFAPGDGEGRGPRPPPREDGPPVQVQDAAGRPLPGSPRLPQRADILTEPIRVGGQVVGHVARPRFPARLLPEEEHFNQRQTRALWTIGGASLLVATLLAGLIAAMILRPLRRLSAATSALAQRDFATRLRVTSGDELGQLADDFNRLAEALERFDARQRQWLADIAHELRTPLAVLRGELEAVLEGVRPATAAATRSLHEEVLRLSALVDDLHLLSVAESGGLTLNRTPTPLGARVAATVERFRERFAARKFELRVQRAEPDPMADIDDQRMDQVLVNLLENVLRYADPPGPVIVSVARDPELRVRVADAGPGVPTDALPRLFDRLYRADSARSRSTGGSGLGLSICRSIVEAHGGRIRAERSEAGGLAISFTLPEARA